MYHISRNQLKLHSSTEVWLPHAKKLLRQDGTCALGIANSAGTGTAWTFIPSFPPFLSMKRRGRQAEKNAHNLALRARDGSNHKRT